MRRLWIKREYSVSVREVLGLLGIQDHPDDYVHVDYHGGSGELTVTLSRATETGEAE